MLDLEDPASANAANPVLLAADNHNLAAGNTSWFSGVGSALTYGLGGAVASGITSVLNTGISVANWALTDKIKEIDLADKLRGFDTDFAKYYTDHQEGIDLAGFALTSIIPGLAGVKALRMVQGGVLGSNMARATSLLPSAYDSALQAAKLELAAPNTPFKILTGNTLKAVSAGYGAEVLDAAAFELGVAAMMQQSPVLQEQSLGDMTANVLWGAGLGGLIGGSIRFAKLTSELKTTVKEVDSQQFPFRHLQYDERATPDLNIITVMRSMRNTPATEDETLKRLAEQKMLQGDNLIKKELQKVTNGDQPLVENLFKLVKGSQNEDELIDNIGLIRAVTRVGEADSISPSKIWYLDKRVTFDDFAKIADSGEHEKLFAKTAADSIGKQGWYIPGTLADVKVAGEEFAGSRRGVKNVFANKDEAFDAGYDVFFNRKGSMQVNPDSKTIRSVNRSREDESMILDVRTGKYYNTAVSTLADTVKSPAEIKVTADQVITPKRAYNMTGDFDPLAGTAVEVNARYVWGLDAQIPVKNGMAIAENDLPMLERAARTAGIDELYINAASGDYTISGTNKIYQFLERKKEELAKVGVAKGIDARELAIRLNVAEDWFDQPSARGLVFDDVGTPYKDARYMKMYYNTSGLKDVDGNIARGQAMMEAQRLAYMERAEFTFKNWAGEQADLPAPETIYQTVKQASREGGGPNFISFANGEPGSIQSFMERLGSWTRNQFMAVNKATKEELESAFYKLANDKSLATEFNMVRYALLATPEQYVIHTADKALVLRKFYDTDVSFLQQAAKKAEAEGKIPEYIKLSDAVYDAYRVHTELNLRRQIHKQNVYSDAGLQHIVNAETPTVYPIPIDTTKQKYFFMVRDPSGAAGSTSHVTSVVAPDAATLRAKEQAVRAAFPEFQVIYKSESIDYHVAEGNYQYSRGLNENHVNSALARRGILSDLIPPTADTAEGHQRIIREVFDWHEKQDLALTRDMVEHRYGDTFSEITQLGKAFMKEETSIYQGIGQALLNSVNNPYMDLMKTALNVSKQREYPFWSLANEKLEQLATTAFSTVKRLFETVDMKSLDTAAVDLNKAAQKLGLGTPYADGMAVLVGNRAAQEPVLGKFIAKANAVLSGTVLSLDPLQGLVNIISSPVIYSAEMKNILRAIESADPKVAGKLADLKNVMVPGSEGQMALPSATKLMARAIGDYFGDQGSTILARYKQMGVVFDDLLEQHKAMVGLLAIKGNETSATLNKIAEDAFRIGGKFTGNEFAERFTRFVGARSMELLTDVAVEAQVMTRGEASAYIQTFVNRVQGNYVASQRPILFQGAIGQAIGLFQTYQFNLMQQLFRYLGDGSSRSAATLLAMQGTIFGMQGLPAFNAINTHIVGNASGNPQHKDLYTGTYQITGKEAGDWLLFGLGSNALGLFSPELKTNLYARGDINPRHVTVVPITDPSGIPIVKATANFTTNLVDAFSRMFNGANVKETVLQALEHNGINRPLAGIATLSQGYSTTSKGSLLSSNDFWSVSSAIRVLGGKPFDEALALDSLYRLRAYDAKDRARIEDLGEAVKTTLVKNQVPSDADLTNFATEYAKSGGKINNFNRFMMQQMTTANTSQVNMVAQKMNNPTSRGLQTVMGGELLPDFTATEHYQRTAGNLPVASPELQQQTQPF